MAACAVRRRWVGLAAAVLVFGLPDPSAAGCKRICSQGSDCDQLSGDARWRCIRGPSSGGCQTVCRDAHGAIAYSRATGAFGFSFDHDSAGRAQRIAQANCAKNAKPTADCRIVASVIDQCAAIAAATGQDAHPATGATRQAVEQQSLAACRARDGQGCKTVAWTCSK